MTSSPADLDPRWVAALRHPLAAPDLEAAWAAVEQRSRVADGQPRGSRRWPPRVAAVAAVALLVAGLAVWRGASDDGEGVKAQQPPPAAPGAWERLPDLPIPPRSSAVTFALGDEVFVVGGTAEVCASPGRCPPSGPDRTDGVALDLRTGSWRRIAAAPFPVQGQAVVVGDVVYLVTPGPENERVMVRYDPRGDSWATFPAPRGESYARFTMVAAGDVLAAVVGPADASFVSDLVFDPEAGTWIDLPPAPVPVLGDSTAIGVEGGFLLLGRRLDDRSRTAPLEMARYDLATGRWRRLPAPDARIERGPWLVDGTQVVCADTPVGSLLHGVVADPLQPRCGLFDLGSETWSPLPDRPEVRVPQVGAVGDERAAYVDAAVFGGLVLDLSTRRWVRIPRLPAVEGDEEDESRPVAAVGRDLVAVGGIRSHGEGMDATDERLTDVWVWRAP